MVDKQSDFEEQWKSLPLEMQSAMAAAWRLDVPPGATALYCRWWQLETWLRSLIYVELRSAFGAQWAEGLKEISEKRQSADRGIWHMPTPDSQARLAYADASELFAIIDKHWTIFEPSLFTKGIWMGRVEELKHIRNRIGHCRRPHADDLARVEQTLRDLETGAFRALSAFNWQSHMTRDVNDPVVDAWVKARHIVALRLLDHADKQYDTSFDLYASRRPWSERIPPLSTISGKQGYVWHARWHFRGDRWLDLREFWSTNFPQAERDAILLVCSSNSSSIEVSFSALEDADLVADAIGSCFDAILMGLRRNRSMLTDQLLWGKSYADLDPRVDAGGLWSIVDASTTPITVFGA